MSNPVIERARELALHERNKLDRAAYVEGHWGLIQPELRFAIKAAEDRIHAQDRFRHIFTDTVHAIRESQGHDDDRHGCIYATYAAALAVRFWGMLPIELVDELLYRWMKVTNQHIGCKKLDRVIGDMQDTFGVTDRTRKYEVEALLAVLEGANT